MKEWLEKKAPTIPGRASSQRKSRWNPQEQQVLTRYIEQFRTGGEIRRKILLKTQVMPDFIRTCRSDDITDEEKKSLKRVRRV